jgi:hypothetical protein
MNELEEISEKKHNGYFVDLFVRAVSEKEADFEKRWRLFLWIFCFVDLFVRAVSEKRITNKLDQLELSIYLQTK